MKTYVDMDSVLVDFDYGIQQRMPYCRQNWRHVHSNYVKEVFEDIRGTDFFEHLPTFHSTNTLLKCIQNIAGGFTILSKPLMGDWDNSAKMKRRWLDQNLLLDPDDIIFTDDKSQYAYNNVLIDDQEMIIAEWNQHCGFGIHWNAATDKLSDVLVPLTALYKGY